MKSKIIKIGPTSANRAYPAPLRFAKICSLRETSDTLGTLSDIAINLGGDEECQQLVPCLTR